MKTLTSISKHSDWLDSIDIVILYKWNLHRKRVNFGKQPLAIYQFVPCKLVDGEWVVLEEPLNYKKWESKRLNTPYDLDLSKYEKYQEALDKVLFEGIEVIIENKEEEKFFVTIAKEKTWILCSWFYINGTVKENNRNITTIEDLAPYNLPLTKTALKDIGL